MGEKTWGCKAIYDFNLIFRDGIALRTVAPCCEEVLTYDFQMPLGKTGKETIENFIQAREQALIEMRGEASERIMTKRCVKCFQYRYGNWEETLSKEIKFLDLTMYPALCQCKCVYCALPTKDVSLFGLQDVQLSYEVLMDAMDYARSIGLITSNTMFHVATGEITIHPYKDEVFEIIGKNKAIFATNCFKFDKRIAKNLHVNPESQIDMSIDSGSRVTWNKIKRVDNFDVVLQNLIRYKDCTVNDDQIALKYIVLPDLNDNLADYCSMVNILRMLEVNQLRISRDLSSRYGISDENRASLVESVAIFILILKTEGLSYILELFSSDEELQIEEKVEEFMKDEAAISRLDELKKHIIKTDNQSEI